MEKGFPKFHVLDHWTAAHDLVRVELVEVALNRREQLFGGNRGVRIVLSDQDGDEQASLVLCRPAALELAVGIGRALQRDEALSEEK